MEIITKGMYLQNNVGFKCTVEEGEVLPKLGDKFLYKGKLFIITSNPMLQFKEGNKELDNTIQFYAEEGLS